MGSRADSAFSHVLDEVGRLDDGERRLGSVDAALGRSFASFAAPFAPDAKGQYGPSEGWDQALDWIAEPQEAAPAPAVAGPPSDDPDAIAAELGLFERAHLRPTQPGAAPIHVEQPPGSPPRRAARTRQPTRGDRQHARRPRARRARARPARAVKIAKITCRRRRSSAARTARPRRRGLRPPARRS